MSARDGGCRCGTARFRASGQPKFICRCHCASCRKATGAEFATWVGFASEDVQWLAAPTFVATSPGVRRGFCATCGAPLSYESDKWPGETHLLIGAFDSADDLRPTTDVFIEEALPWAPPPLA